MLRHFPSPDSATRWAHAKQDLLRVSPATANSKDPAIAKWSGLGLCAAYGWCAARLNGAPHHKALLHGGAVALIGAAVIAVKALVH